MLRTLVMIVGVLMSFGYFPQAYRIFKKKNADDVSILSFSIFAVGTFLYTLYGISRDDDFLAISFIVGVVGSWLVLGLTLYYRYAKKRHKKKDVVGD